MLVQVEKRTRLPPKEGLRIALNSSYVKTSKTTCYHYARSPIPNLFSEDMQVLLLGLMLQHDQN